MKTLSCETDARTAVGEPPCLPVPEVLRAPNEFDDLPDELPDVSVGRELQRCGCVIRPRLDYKRNLGLIFVLRTKLPQIGGAR